jgi:hypothetical protein
LRLVLAYLIFAENWASALPPFYKWRAKYGGMDVSMISRMKELKEENRRLKKMYLVTLTRKT